MKDFFDKNFVNFLWDDELDGKECFVACEIQDLIQAVNINSLEHKCVIHKSPDLYYPFQTRCDCTRFAYYDPLYEYKLAWANGKSIKVETGGHTYLFENGEDEEPMWYYSEGTSYCVVKDLFYVHKKEGSGDLFYDDCNENHIYKGTEESCISYIKKYSEPFEKWLSNYRNNVKNSFGIRMSFLASEDVVDMLKDAYIEGKRNMSD